MLSERMQEAVISKAVKAYKKFNQENPKYAPEDAFVYALEEYDTGYDLTKHEWNDLESTIKSRCGVI